jgi:hypothetical protein
MVGIWYIDLQVVTIERDGESSVSASHLAASRGASSRTQNYTGAAKSEPSCQVIVAMGVGREVPATRKQRDRRGQSKWTISSHLNLFAKHKQRSFMHTPLPPTEKTTSDITKRRGIIQQQQHSIIKNPKKKKAEQQNDHP